MVETKFTAGPWRISAPYSSVVGIGITAANPPAQVGVAIVPGYQREIAEANARLIAAAPDLLATTKSVAELVEDLCKRISRAAYEAEELERSEAWKELGQWLDEGMRDGFWASYRMQFEQAIAKAEGR